VSDHFLKLPQVNLKSLETYYRGFAYRHGRSGSQGMKILALNSKHTNTTDINVAMDCFAYMKIFGWWAQNEESLLMYFENQKQLDNARQWIEKNHSEIWVGQMKNTKHRNRA
jgi:hypothetical protein